jgi:glycosyltransferase involved in cell wall biosynthesis
MDKIINLQLAVVMPVYNAAAFLHESIISVLTQTYSNFLFYIIDDGSTDGSANIINGFQDERIIYSKNPANRGIVQTLNKAFQNINAKYIVRMDADDIAIPTRFQQQVEFMDNNPNISIAGSWFKYMDESVYFRPPLFHDDIAIALLEYSPIGHPTVIIRKADWDKAGLYYSDLYPHAEDFACWTNAVLQQYRLANIPEFLLAYRKHELQVSSKFQNLQNDSVQRIRKNYITNIFPEFNIKDIDLLFDLFSNKILSFNQYKAVMKLIGSNSFEDTFLKAELLKNFIQIKIALAAFNIYVIISDPTIKMFRQFITDKYFYSQLSFIQRCKFPIKLIKKLSFG